MFRTAMIASILGLGALPALAGGLAPIQPEPVVQAPVPVAPAVRPSADWSGFYLGAQGSYATFDWEQGTTSGSGESTGIWGGHAGYMHDFGNFVVGGEATYDSLTSITDIVPGTDGESMIALKARLGYDMGRILPYVTAGGAYLTTTGGIADSDSGYLYGAGADFALTDTWRLGAEVTQSRFDDFAGSGQDITGTQATLRVSFAF
ncbi:MAG: outer membrane beta-barrel protein [Rubellimicrobium sp.]|nr:outer membrane beta-barrel protein [Rubellimicrobium sp.]